MTVSLIESLQVGKPAYIAHGSKQVLSGIYKQPTSASLLAGQTGIEGDGQGDTVHHGGPDKAICAYFAQHYPYWEQRLGRSLPYGSFGENLTLSGWTEDELCIGDIVKAGAAELQVSQPRQPCYKLGLRNELPELPAWVQQTGYTGFYFRVLREGRIQQGDALAIAQRHPAGITLAEANRVMYTDKKDVEAIKRLLGTEELAASWREHFESRLSKLEGSGEAE